MGAASRAYLVAYNALQAAGWGVCLYQIAAALARGAAPAEAYRSGAPAAGAPLAPRGGAAPKAARPLLPPGTGLGAFDPPCHRLPAPQGGEVTRTAPSLPQPTPPTTAQLGCSASPSWRFSTQPPVRQQRALLESPPLCAAATRAPSSSHRASPPPSPR